MTNRVIMQRARDSDPRSTFALATEGCATEPGNLFRARQVELLGLEPGVARGQHHGNGMEVRVCT